MPFDWKSLVDLAELLRQHAAAASNVEAHHRSAVNRAYFGAFGYALTYAASYLNYDPLERPDDHGRLRAHLRRSRRQNAADRLDDLRQLRNEADYQSELDWEDFEETVDDAIRQANEVFDILPPPEPRSATKSSS